MYGRAGKSGFRLFSENLKADNMDRLLLMYGSEQYLVNWAVESLIRKYTEPAVRAVDFAALDEDPSCAGIIGAAETFPALSRRRIVWVRNFKPLLSDSAKGYGKDDLESLAAYLKNSNETAILIFSSEEVKGSSLVTSALEQYGQVYVFDKINRSELSSFARKRFREAGIEISPALLSRLIDSTGYFNRESDYRLFSFVNDIRKIIAHSDGNKVTEDDIDKTVRGDAETFVFHMLDGLSGNRREKAFRVMYNMLRSGTDPYYVIGAIASQFELMLSVRQLRGKGMGLREIHRELGGSEYRIKKLIPYADRYPEDKLKKILTEIYETDRNIKTGLLDARTALELFTAGI